MKLLFILFCALGACLSAETTQEARDKDLLAFETWFKEKLSGSGRTEIDKLKAVPREVAQAWRDRDAYRGLYATEDIDDEQTLLAIPWHLMITTEKIGVDHKELKEIYEEHKLNQQEALGVYLVFLKHCLKDNFWAPWLKILPSKFNSILYFTQDEIKLLEGSFLATRALWRQQQSKSNFEALSEHIFPHLPGQCTPITYDDWRWAEAIVDSRSIDLINEATDQTRFSAIAPYFDLLNHDNPAEGKDIWGYNSKKMLLHVEASRAYHPSEQIFISYGPKCNDELVEKYGFIIDDNDDECVHVDFNNLLQEVDAIPNSDPLKEKRRALLLDKNQRVTDYSYQILPAAVTQELLFVAEVLSYTEDETVGQSNLHKVQWLVKFVEKLHKRYPSSVADDDALIESAAFNKISKRARLAIELRRGEKALLEEVLGQYKKVEASILQTIQQKGEGEVKADSPMRGQLKEEL